MRELTQTEAIDLTGRFEAGQEIPEAMRADVRMLGALLGRVLRESGSPGLYEDVERLRAATIQAYTDETPEAFERAAVIADSFTIDRADEVARAFTCYFHLVNLAEEHQRVRVLRERDGRPDREDVTGSVAAAFVRLAAEVGDDTALEHLQNMRFHPVFTAHPTEARRRAVSTSIRRLASFLDEHDASLRNGADQRRAERRMLEEIDGVKWIPETGRNRIDAMVRNRPDWCVSRQRAWGVGVPIFYGMPSRTPVMDPWAVEKVAQVVEEGGSDAWFSLSPRRILGEDYVHPETGETEFAKETDTLDVWFDSGSTSLVVLMAQIYPEWKAQGLHWPADLYLEGSDQHRGWFNTSLILGTAVGGQAPYKTVLTHGFIVDGDGRKISKRAGNGVEPIEASDTYGADILRLWVATVDYTNDAPISDAILKQCGELYRNVRNVLRFLLANCAGFSGSITLLPIDEWAVERTDLLVADVVDAYARYDFGAAFSAVHDFCRETLSRFYLDAIKDRMYCETTDGDLRRSGQAACRDILVRLIGLLAPILAHTAEETWEKLREASPLDGMAESVFFGTFLTPSAERLSEIQASPLGVRFASLLSVRELVSSEFEKYKGTDGIKSSEDTIAILHLDSTDMDQLEKFSPDELAILFRVSAVEFVDGGHDAEFRPSPYEKCVRSRLRRPDVAPVEFEGETLMLTLRDREVLGV